MVLSVWCRFVFMLIRDYGTCSLTRVKIVEVACDEVGRMVENDVEVGFVEYFDSHGDSCQTFHFVLSI